MEENTKTAVVIGATGLTGSQLIQVLLNDSKFNKVIAFVRRPSGVNNVRLTEHIIDFDQPHTWQDLVRGDIFFSALGSTLKQAGGKDAQYKIDFSYQFEFAKAAAQNGIPVYVLVSAPHASPDSRLFYPRMKGELEQEVKKMAFSSITLLQPSLLYGGRKNERFGEKLSYRLLRAFNAIGLFKRYRPVHGRVVARAMVNAGITADKGIHVYTLDEIFALAGEK